MSTNIPNSSARGDFGSVLQRGKLIPGLVPYNEHVGNRARLEPRWMTSKPHCLSFT